MSEMNLRGFVVVFLVASVHGQNDDIRSVAILQNRRAQLCMQMELECHVFVELAPLNKV